MTRVVKRRRVGFEGMAVTSAVDRRPQLYANRAPQGSFARNVRFSRFAGGFWAPTYIFVQSVGCGRKAWSAAFGVIGTRGGRCGYKSSARSEKNDCTDLSDSWWRPVCRRLRLP